MAQLFFKYGAMNSGKTIEILKVAHNYEEQNKPVLIMTSGIDNRDETGVVSSRIGLRRSAVSIYDETDILEVVDTLDYNPACVLIDESQFLKKAHILQLTKVVDELGIPVMAFGLKNDFQNELFEGSKYLLLYADKIEEMKTICWYCHKKATMNLRIVDGKPVYAGEQIQIGGNESYLPVCRKHYHHPPQMVTVEESRREEKENV
ncbi:thymidine kinase [Pisciglobus halotolerans]|uniref:Thymidine kinase n=1 Tax=Pisciglobus halotolerans TaxID=745365 RepID=A0A1I3C7N1_9LACT|nr:thymidine kinase [Pisciglobus halotolerans]SFH70413.1 thymidine kinase [Pisciglobus halotolerans]